MNIKKKIMCIIFILISFLLIFFINSSKVEAYSIPDPKTNTYHKLGENVGSINYSDVVNTSSNRKFYCIDHGGALTDKLSSEYIIVGYMEIDGTTVTYYSNWDDASTKSKHVTAENIDIAPYIAALLNKEDGWGTGYGSAVANKDGTGSGTTKAQRALWSYWNTFLKKIDAATGASSNANNLFTSWGGRNPDNMETSTIKKYVDEKQDKNFKAYIYVLYCYDEAKLKKSDAWQRLLYATTETEEKPSITIDKTWSNLEEAIGDTSTLKSINVSIRYKDGDNAQGIVINDKYENIKIDLDSSTGHGTKKIYGIPEKGKSLTDYIVVESGGNTINYITAKTEYDEASSTIYLTNTINNVRFKVKKTWSDIDTTYRPTSLTFYLVKRDKNYYEKGNDKPVETIEYTKDNEYGLITEEDAKESADNDSNKDNADNYYEKTRYVTTDDEYVYEYKLEKEKDGWKIKKYKYQLIEKKVMTSDKWEAEEEKDKFVIFDTIAEESTENYTIIEDSANVERYTSYVNSIGNSSMTVPGDYENIDGVEDVEYENGVMYCEFEAVNMYGSNDITIGDGDYTDTAEDKVIISGYVWLDKFGGKDSIQNGLKDKGEEGINGIRVTWYDALGKKIATTTTRNNGENMDGYYEMKVDSPIHKHPYWKDFVKYTLINLSYVEFEYNGVQYTTTLPTLITDIYNTTTSGERKNQISSMAIEGQEQRDILNNKFAEVMNGGTSGGVSIDYEVTGINSVTGTANASVNAIAEGLYYTGNNTMYSTLISDIKDLDVKVGFLEYAKTKTRTGLCHKHCYWGILEMKTLIEGDSSESGYILNGVIGLIGKVLDHKFVNIKVSPNNSHFLMYMPNWLGIAASIISLIFGGGYVTDKWVFKIECNPIVTWNENSPYIMAVLSSVLHGSHCRTEVCGGDSSTDDVVEWRVENVNCGLIEREQPDLTIESDVATVEINMNGQDHTYAYANRTQTVNPTYLSTFADFVAGYITNDQVTDVTSLLKYANRPSYEREVNPSDVVYSKYYKDTNQQFSDDFKVYVTYNTKIYNQSYTIPAKVNSIINYFDNRYQEVVEVSASANKDSGVTEINASVGNIGTVASSFPESDIFSSAVINLQEDAWIKPTLVINDPNADFASFVTVSVKYLVKPSTVAGELFEETAVNLMHISEIYSYSSRYGLYTVFANGLPADGAGVLETFMKQVTGENSDVTNSNVLNETVTQLTSTLKKLYSSAVQLLVGSLDYYQGNFKDENGDDVADSIENNKNEVGKYTSTLTMSLISFMTGQSAQEVKEGLERSVDNMNTTFDVLTSKVRYNGVYKVVYYSGFDKDSEPGDSEAFIRAINICYSSGVNFDKAITNLIGDMWSQIASPDTLKEILLDTKNLEYILKGDIQGLLKNLGNNVTGKLSDVLGGLEAQANNLFDTIRWGVFKLLEDDTDIAPMMKLKLDDQYKTVSGFVWEDSQTNESLERNEREGDGKYNPETERKAVNVRVTLYEVDGTSGALMPTQLYIRKNDRALTITPVPGTTFTNAGGTYLNFNGNVFRIISETDQYYVVEASTVTNQNGEYTFTGLIEDEYQVQFQYDKTATVIGTNHELDGKNYKSTIITNELVKQLFTGETSYATNTDWHIQLAESGIKDVSVAADDMNLRCQQEKDLVNGNCNQEITMIARTNNFKLQVEYVRTNDKKTEVKDNGEPEDGSTFSKDLVDVFNFGVVTRAKEDISIDKTIDSLTITLANGQVLVDGNPFKDSLSYTVALGSKETTKTRSSNYAGRRVRTEVDTELLHGATLDIVYKITARNDGEIDYKYAYVEGQNQYLYNKYYYFGDRTDIETEEHGKVDSTILEVIDYLDSDVTIVDDIDTQTGNWMMVDNIEDLKGTNSDTKIVSEEVYKELEDNRNKYTILKTEIFKNLKASTNEEERSQEIKLHVSKLLGNQSEQYNYSNGIEIVKIGKMIARSRVAKHDDNYKPQYIPGNYVPSKNVGNEQDSDKIDYIITPPTGTKTAIIYVISIAIGLMVIAVGVVVTKKFIVKK